MASGTIINLLIGDVNDPYWGQVFEGMHQAAQQMGLTINYLMENLPFEPSREEETALLAELKAQKLSVLIDSGTSKYVAEGLLDAGIALVHLTETNIRHPRSTSPIGLYDAAQMAGKYLAETLNGKGRILMVGGLLESIRSEIGQSRVKGFTDYLANYPQISIEHLAIGWTASEANEAIPTFVGQHPGHFDAIFGLSDMLAITARNSALALGCVTANTPVIGINGDPLALAAIAAGNLSATIETAPTQLGREAIELAFRISQNVKAPEHYHYNLRLVTTENVNQVSAEKLLSLADLPNRLINFERQQHNERMRQLETSLEINHSVGAILDLQQLSLEIANRIRTNYDYDDAYLYQWLDTEQILLRGPVDGQRTARISIDQAPQLAEVVKSDQLYATSSGWNAEMEPSDTIPAQIVSRLVIPIHFSGRITHLLDLHSRKGIMHTRQELIGLQALADQFGIAIRNAELFREALDAREDALAAKAQAEKADNLKTRLLANVSHELRTPLKTILQYSRAALSEPDKSGLVEKMRSNLTTIQENGEHLVRLINDLLDLSSAEIDELDLSITALNPYNLITDAFAGIATHPSSARHNVHWQLDLPAYLPVIHADPPRLRQILLNLLSNANKFTKAGSITLGAEVSLPHLHLWVKDTGDGIPANIQEHIFEPFITAETTNSRHAGIGLGLTITRRLIALHGGSLSLESHPGQGSTFHIYLPLPSLAGDNLLRTTATNPQPMLLMVKHTPEISPILKNFCAAQHLEPYPMEPGDNFSDIGDHTQAQAIAWDISTAQASEWTAVQKLRSHPKLGLLPFLLFGANDGDQPTGIQADTQNSKPEKHQTLFKMIQSLQPGSLRRDILIVEDAAQSGEMYKDLLTNQLADFNVVTLGDSSAAVAYLSRETPAIVIINLGTPYADIFRLLNFIRSHETAATPPVLIMSERNLSYEDARHMDYEQVIFLTKNILSPSETVLRVRHALNEKDFLPPPTSELVKQALVFIHQNFDHAFSLQEIASTVGISKSYFSQIFRIEMGLPLWEYLNRFRVQRAKDYLRSTVLPVTEISMRVGFDDFSYFGRVFNKYSGCSPRAYRQKSPE